MSNRIDSLYTFAKKISQQKDRPLKIICDWDECIMPLRPAAIYKFLGNEKYTFKEFFELFWERIVAVNEESGFKIHDYKGSEEEKLAVEKYKEMRKLRNS